MTRREEQIGWLRTLVGMYRAEHDWDADPDPCDTLDMLTDCSLLADELEALERRGRDTVIAGPPADRITPADLFDLSDYYGPHPPPDDPDVPL